MRNSSKSSPVMKRLSKRGPDEEAYLEATVGIEPAYTALQAAA
jgi:hypothetical protein